ncbi:hypothetical protein SR870_10945 [Rhodopseudomonas palustris]|uniref:hypothetical protein n=1 Tax=Rhodopseudomonas palustris TaxID=1076 RepID=UPI002ACED2D2|nr:hypothetical protein [Rhodopseudomonas palustris]WQH01751.1 hypothetical protein SR870_10945 [Rhodopseudomonas palustris]
MASETTIPDAFRSTLFEAPLRRALDAALQPGERVLWQAQPDAYAAMMMVRALWWIGVPWLALALLGLSRGWLGDWIGLPLLLGVALVLGPFVVLLHHLHTLYVVTDRRALILRAGLGRDRAVATDFGAMNQLEVLDIRGRGGHLSFASRASTASPDTDFTGRYGFRFLPDVAAARGALEAARGAAGAHGRR